MEKLPRLLICGAASGSGKTTVTCAVLQALVNRKKNPIAFKCGPDFIDPMFHSRVIGVKSSNLDLFLLGRDVVRQLLWENGRNGKISIIEGVMGYYDGIGVGSDASSWDLSIQTDTPVVLVIDGRGRSLSASAEVAGFSKFRKPSNIEGVIINRISASYYPKMKEMIERETGVKVYGFLPEIPECNFDSRHLGLITADEVRNLKKKLQRLSENCEKTIDLDGLIKIADNAPTLDVPEISSPVPVEGKPKIAVARDKAFCFYYEDAISLIKKLGADIAEFSPMYDNRLPEGCGGLYLGGGYPELYAEILADNKSMRLSVKKAVEEGMPTIAECGGFIYLNETLKDGKGINYPMAGVLRGKVYPNDRLRRFGYVTLTAQNNGILGKKSTRIPAHEFHYWDCDNSGNDFKAKKPQSDRGWDCGFTTNSLYAGFPHLHLCAVPESALKFVSAADNWSKMKGEKL